MEQEIDPKTRISIPEKSLRKLQKILAQDNEKHDARWFRWDTKQNTAPIPEINSDGYQITDINHLNRYCRAEIEEQEFCSRPSSFHDFFEKTEQKDYGAKHDYSATTPLYKIIKDD